ncbi:MAG: insulinase family protein [Acidobacteria bacterium]|nr:insulinase family protein [Acidobacteriota bacterium]
MAHSRFPALCLGTLAALACLGSDGRTASAQQAPVLSVAVEQFTLPNGLHVILHRDASIPTVTVNVWYHVGSGSEKVGRTGFAHLFEHLMFEGSKHVAEGDFDNLLEAAGANNNGSTNGDRTNYYIEGPRSALDLMLFLDSDRMAYLLDTMSPARVDGQRDVVKNERRQGVENQPYGLAELEIGHLLYPKNHPYHWPTIGYMEDLTAASHQDVVDFFKTYYAPNNASLVVAGDIDLAEARRLVEKWFTEVPRGADVPPIAPPAAYLTSVVSKTMTDRVQLPRLYMAWHSPATLTPGDAELDLVGSVLTGGKNSRLYKRLVFDLQIAQEVVAGQQSASLGSSFLLMATARPPKDGETHEGNIARIKAIVDEEIALLQKTPPSARELERAVNQYEAQFYDTNERVGRRADMLNRYYTLTGNPDYFNEDLARYRALAPSDVSAAARTWLSPTRRVEITVLPEAR